jgi:hypothetical protein
VSTHRSRPTVEPVLPQPATDTDAAKPVPVIVRACPSCGQAIGAMLSTEVICPSPGQRP